MTSEFVTRANEITSGVAYPPVPIYAIAQDFGVEVRKEALSKATAAVIIVSSDHCVVGINQDLNPRRSRCVVAQSVGYMCLGCGDHQVIIGREAFSASIAVSDGELLRRDTRRFMMELLMPKNLLAPVLRKGVDIQDEATIHRMSRRWEVPDLMMAVRLNQLTDGYLM